MSIPQFELRAVKDLKPHPGLVRTHLLPTPARLAELDGLGERLLKEPIVITHEGFIVDGHARWMIAQRRGWKTLVCEVRALSQGNALVQILERKSQCRGFNSYSRAELALLLEPGLRKLKLGGAKQDTSTSNLTRSGVIDCRPEIARMADVSIPNLSKVRTILGSAIPRLRDELRADRVSIHAGWKLAQKSPADQEREIGWLRTRARRNRRLDKVLSLVETTSHSFADALRQVRTALRELTARERLAKLAAQLEELLLAIEHELQADEEASKSDNS